MLQVEPRTVVLDGHAEPLAEGDAVREVPAVRARPPPRVHGAAVARLAEVADAPRVAEVVLGAGADPPWELVLVDPDLLVPFAPPARHRVVDGEGRAHIVALTRRLEQPVVQGAAVPLVAPVGEEVEHVRRRLIQGRPLHLESHARGLLQEAGELEVSHLAVRHRIVEVRRAALVARDEAAVLHGIPVEAEEAAEGAVHLGLRRPIPNAGEHDLPPRVPLLRLHRRADRADHARTGKLGEVHRLPRLHHHMPPDRALPRQGGLRVRAGPRPGRGRRMESLRLLSRQRQAEALHRPVLGISEVVHDVELRLMVHRRDLDVSRERYGHIAVRRAHQGVAVPAVDEGLDEGRLFACEQVPELPLVRGRLGAVQVDPDLAHRVR